MPAAIRQGKAPILLANESTDRQVVAAPNLRVAEDALGTETPLRHAQLLPGLNHVLQENCAMARRRRLAISSEEYSCYGHLRSTAMSRNCEPETPEVHRSPDQANPMYPSDLNPMSQKL